MNRNDALLIAALLLCALLVGARFVLGETGARSALIEVDGVAVGEMLLGSPAVFQGEGAAGPFTVEVTPEGVRVTQSACPDQLCVRQGLISRAGQSVVCLPNHLCVTLSGGYESQTPDAIAY